MANIVKFKINGLSSALNNVYTRVTDLSRNELYSGNTLVSDSSGNVELDIGDNGVGDQGVLVYVDDYSSGNELTFKSTAGYSTIEAPVYNDVYSLAGNDSYFVASDNIRLEAGDTVEFEYIAKEDMESGVYQYLVDTKTSSPRAALAYSNNSTGLWFTSTLITVEIDGTDRAYGSLAPLDGLEHKVKLTAISACYIGTFGARFGTFVEKGGMTIKNVVITRAAGNINLPLTKKSDGAIQTSDTAITATIVNYDANNWIEYTKKVVGNNPYQYMLFFGDSYIARSYSSFALAADTRYLLREYGVYTTAAYSAVPGTDFEYFNDTLMPSAVASYGALPDLACFIQSTYNSLDFPWLPGTQQQKDDVTAAFQGVVNQSAAAGWTTFTKNFPFTPTKVAFDMASWNSELALPMAQNSAPLSLTAGGDFFIDNSTFSAKNNYLFFASDGIHFKEGSGDRAYRQFEAACIANRLGKLPSTSLAGRRVVLSWGGTADPYWRSYNNISRLAHATSTATPAIPSKAFNCQVLDADTGVPIPWLYVAVTGYQSANLTGGSGNAGNTSSSYLNNTALSGNFSHGATYAGMQITIGNIYDIALPNATITVAASSNVSDAVSKTDWTANGETKQVDAALVPCGLATFNNVPAVDNKIVINGVIASGSTKSYLSAIEVQFD